jgi:hypothetical protein
VKITLTFVKHWQVNPITLLHPPHESMSSWIHLKGYPTPDGRLNSFIYIFYIQIHPMNVHIGDKAIVNMLHKQTMAFMSLLPSLLSPAWSTSSAYVFKLCVILSLWWAFTKSALCGWGQPEAPSWNTILLYILFFLIILNQGCEHGEVGALVWVL